MIVNRDEEPFCVAHDDDDEEEQWNRGPGNLTFVQMAASAEVEAIYAEETGMVR